MSPLDLALAKARANGIDPTLLIVNTTDVADRLAGEGYVRDWCAAHRLEGRITRAVPGGTMYLIAARGKHEQRAVMWRLQ